MGTVRTPALTLGLGQSPFLSPPLCSQIRIVAITEAAMAQANWVEIGKVADLRARPLQMVQLADKKLALSFRDGKFGLISNVCNHVGGPLSEGTIDDKGYVTCPWHYWKFERCTGLGEPGFEQDKVPAYILKEEGGKLFADLASVTRRNHLPHDPHPLARKIERADGPPRVVGISTTSMTEEHPRFSASDALLQCALEHAAESGAQTQLIRLHELTFRACEGFYSKSARACTWPCSITAMDSKDQLDRVYEAFVHWADVLLVATPIRWGAASSLYYKMVERMNCIQNQITTHNRVLMKNKVAAFIIIGGQDNVQAVAGQMLGFFSEIGCAVPPFPFVGHSRGWAAEDMENNVREVQHSEALREGTRALVDRALKLSASLLGGTVYGDQLARGGRKAFHLPDQE